MLLRQFLFAALSLFVLPAFCQSTDRYTIIPRPAQLEPRAGAFKLDQNTAIMVPFDRNDISTIVGVFVSQVNRSSGMALSVSGLTGQNTRQNSIQFLPSQAETLGDEGYRIDVTDNRIRIEARQPKGFFYAVQTLFQLLPPGVLGQGTLASVFTPGSHPLNPPPALSLIIPACRIQDQPRYRYRGMNLDVSRHFFSVAFIKKYLDLMALHKFNTFHWHLTDDQGWRIESKKYPRLTQEGSLRRETIVGHYDDFDPQVFDGKPYGGFYTQDDIREVVAYAATKFIDVVPEIELPGHALAALATYPELACSPGPYQVATKWGVFGEVFCPTEKTFTFLENVLTEVMALFPGKYIHIGGDECPKTVWRKSPFCQQLIKQQGLKNEFELQRYFIGRIDKFVTAKGRRIIGWDEILEGSGPRVRLSPSATVMSWRGIKGGIAAARQGHDVIMTPGAYCYLNFYQGDPAQEPTAFGGHLPLANVYAYDPTPPVLSATEATHILGAQGNLWTEYITTPDEAEYMLWPRAAALAEVVWTPATQKNYTDFARRLPVHFERLANLNVNYARTFYDALPLAQPTATGSLIITLTATGQTPDIRYTVDGSIPSGESPLYGKPFTINQSATVRTATFRNGKPLSELAKIKTEYIISKATGKPYKYLAAPITSRPDRMFSLTDGTTGGIGGYEVAGMVSFRSDMNVTIDLRQLQAVEGVQVGFLKYTARNICLPRQVEVLVSDDGTTFRPVLTAKTNAAESGLRAIVRLPFAFAPTTARYVRIIARNAGRVPAGLRNPGQAAQLAVDEVEVR